MSEEPAAGHSEQYLIENKKKRLLDRKNINDFISTIQKDRHAYEIFRKEAERSGLAWASPLSKQ